MDRSRLRRLLPPPRRFAVYSGVSVLLGVLVVLVMGVGRPDFYRPATFVAGALLGFCLNAGAILGEAMLFGLLGVSRRWDRRWRLALGLLAWFLGGGVGFLVARSVALALGLGVFASPEVAGPGLVVFGLVAVVVGLAFYLVRVLRRRLESSVARLKEQEHAEKELETARALQKRLLPPPAIAGPGYRIEARNLAARRVAGDFYDVFPLSDGAVGLVVGDVAGKGMAAALLMASVKAMLPLVATERSVAATLDELNRRLVRDLGPREFVALAFLRYEPETGRVELGNAGLPDPYRLGETIRAVELPGPRLPLGARADVIYDSVTWQLGVGEALLLLSDGLPEAPDLGGVPLGYDGLVAAMAGPRNDAGRWLDRLIESARERGATLEDDWTLLLLERCGTFP